MDVSKLVAFYEEHKKFLVAVVAAVAAAASFAADGEFSLNDVVGTLSVFTGAGAVYAVPNKTKRRVQADRVLDEASGR